jgi:AraC-like DNA-binding protein
VQPNWILDYEFNTYGAYRTRSYAFPWKERLPHTAHLYPPDSPYWEDTRREKGHRHSVWLCFAGGEAAGLERLVDPRRRYARFLDPAGRLGRIIRQAALIGERYRQAGFWAAQAMLCRALHLVLGAEHGEDQTWMIGGGAPPSETAGFVEAVNGYLKARLGRRVTLADVSRHLHVSPSTLSHRYRLSSNVTPMAHHLQLRIDQSRMLLLKGTPLKVIADQLGFTDAFHLSKAFKKIEGLSPRNYLRKYQGGR